MLIGSSLDKATLEELSALPSDNLKGRIFIFGKKLYYNDGTANAEIYTAEASGAVPIGTILPFYDYNGSLTFDTSKYEYCNGGLIVNASSPINGQTKPDLSGRYLVGFGTDGGEDVGTAAWSAVAVGNDNHQIDIQHSHTVDNHVHTGPSHTHSVSGTTSNNSDSVEGTGGTSGVFAENPHTHTFSVTSGAGGTGNTGGATPGTDNQLSTTQTIQPKSVKVRYIIRVA